MAGPTNFTKEKKARIVKQAIKNGFTAMAKKYNVSDATIHGWRNDLGIPPTNNKITKSKSKTSQDDQIKIVQESFINGWESTSKKYNINKNTLATWKKRLQSKGLIQEKKVKLLKHNNSVDDGLVIEENVPIDGVWTASPILKYPESYNKILTLKIGSSVLFETATKLKMVKAVRDAIQKRYENIKYVLLRVSATQSRLWRVEQQARRYKRKPKSSNNEG